MKNKMTVTLGAAKIIKAADAWMDKGKGSIHDVTANAAKRLSKDRIFNMAAYLKFNYSGLVEGATDEDWLADAKALFKIAK